MLIALWWAITAPAWTGTAAANPMNPDLSVIGTIAGRWTDDRTAGPRFEAALEEVELGLKSDVDPYLTAEAFLAGDRAGFGVEEAHLDTLALPANLKASLGRIRASFGKLNLTHEHTWYTVTPPLLATNLFDGAAWVDDGARLSWIAPLDTYHEVTVEALRGRDAGSFSGGASADWAGAGHLKNFFDLTDATSLEAGWSVARGPDGPGTGSHTNLGGADLTLKWRPPEANVRRSVALQAEGALVARDRPNPAGGLTVARTPMGWLLLDVQPGQRWHVAARVDGAADSRDPHVHARAAAGVISYSPSEFSNLMIETRGDRAGGHAWTTVTTRLTFSIGPHGAHPF